MSTAVSRPRSLRGLSVLRTGPQRTLAGVVAVVLGAVLIGVVAARATSEEPLSPHSTEPAGTQAIVDVLSELGAAVHVGRPGATDDADRVLVLVDDLDDDERATVESLAANGATVVVADPGSPLSADPAAAAGQPMLAPDPEPDCGVDALEGVGRVRTAGAAFEPAADAIGCFPVADGVWLVIDPVQDGRVVSVGHAGWLTNRELTRADHAALAVALLAPSNDGGRVTVVEPRDVLGDDGQGFDGLLGLVPGPVWAALAQLGVAAALAIAWRARRLGRPVTEPQPVALPGSELVIATGDLLQVTGSATHAAQRLREGLIDDVRPKLGLPADAPGELLAAAAADAGADLDQARHAFHAPLPATDPALVAFARDLEQVRAAVAGGRGDQAARPRVHGIA